jgi:hypothetical protein
VLVINESDQNIPLFYFDIDYVLKEIGENALYFHAYWTRNIQSELGQNFMFLPKIEGKGRYLGVSMGVNAPNYGNTWWGEGEVKLYYDGDTDQPTFCGTGTEDYIGTGWGLGTYIHQLQGTTFANDSTKEYAFYRFHIPDQVFFHEHFSGSIQQIGGGMRDDVRQLLQSGAQLQPVSVQYGEEFRRLLDDPLDIFSKKFPIGWVNFYRVDDYCATTYFYLNKTSSRLGSLAPVEVRVR